MLALRPRSSLAYNNLGVIYLNRGQLDLAKEALKKSLEIDPRYDDAAYLLGLLYHQTEQTEKAKAT
ncbi:MAG: tetratricopeptide repeat protein [Candidatus Binatia bacterium]|nr:tetratricopeptide repeat protein [Candidatus Binatia bacterium]